MKSVRIVCTVAALLVTGVFLCAQTQQGRIVGRVADSSGAVVGHATVTIQNSETGAERVLETNAAGDYSAPNLNPGLYSVIATAPSFQTVERKGVRLEVASDIRIDFQLKPGQIKEVLEVTGDLPMVDTTSDTLGGTLTNKLINELPLQGRDFQNLLELRPGIQRVPGGGFQHVTSNGNRREDNNYLVDGTSDNDVYYGDTIINGAGVLGTPASHLPLDAIQEFNTQENQSAEFGWKPGAVINIGLKSGTNQYHGTGYYFHRNSAFDARNWFNPSPQPVSDLLLHQFGASIGGPIIKDKWFIFGNYEGVRHKVGNPYDVESPVTESLVGKLDPGQFPEDYSLVDARVAAGCPAACSPLSLQLADLFLNNPGLERGTADPTLINFDFNNHNREDNFVIKSDYHWNSKNTITGRYFFTNGLLTEEDTAPLRPEWLSIANTKIAVTGATWTWVPNSRWVNEARFGYSRNWQNDNVADHDRSAQSYGINTGVTDPRLFGFPRISITGFDYMGGNYHWPLYTTPNQTFEWSDNVSVTHGNHNIHFGGELRYGSADNFRAIYGRGRINFSSLVDFLQGNVHNGQVLTGDNHRNVSMTAFGGFVQDDWRIRPRLTLNLGLRYDLSLPVKDSQDRIANFIPGQGIIQVGKGIGSPYATDWNNFSPRVGFAWDIFGNSRTVLRAGGGIIFEQPTIRVFIDSGGLNENPSGAQGVTPGTGNIQVFSRTLSGTDLSAAWAAGTPLFDTSPGGSCDASAPCDVFGVLQHLSTPYVASWNMNLQQQLSRTTSLQVAYVANHGIKLYSHRDLNQPLPSVSTPCIDDGGDFTECEQAATPLTVNCTTGAGPCMPWIHYANYMENMANSSYNALQVTLTQKGFHGLDLLAGYTWAHSIDFSNSNRGGYPQDNNNFGVERGNSDYDIRHRFTLSLAYELPSWKTPFQLGEGWTFTSILNFQTGEPYNYYDSYDDLSYTGEFLDRWDFAGKASDVHWTNDPSKQTKYLVGSDATSNPLCAAHSANPDLGYWGCFVSGSAVITPPAYGTFGNMGRNIFRGPGFANWDMSVTKKWRLSERMALQLRGEFFNIINHPNFDWLTLPTDVSDPVYGINDLGVVQATPDVGASNPVVGSGGSRHIQLGAKIIW